MDPAAASAYGPAFLDHFRRPRGAGTLEDGGATHRATVEDPACGDRLTLDLRVEEGVVRAARWRAEGCVAAIACASALASLVEGRPARPDAPNAEDLERVLGRVPPAKRHGLRLAVATWRAALAGALPSAP